MATKEIQLQDKIIVITGASSGAGRSAAFEFAPYGVNLVLAARNGHALEEVATECRELGAQVLTVITDAKAMINLANSLAIYRTKNILN